MGLCYQTSRWLDRLWSEHLETSQPARELVRTGIAKQGDSFAGFPADLHARMYLPADPPMTDVAPDWATRLHALASELAEWQRLRVLCARNGFAAGIAAEALLKELLPQVPDRPTAPAEPATPSPQPPENAGTSPSPSSPGDTPSSNDTQDGTPSDLELRAALRRAARVAREAVEHAEAPLEGMSTSLGWSAPGNAIVNPVGPANLKAIREMHSRLAGSSGRWMGG
jgi:hypothetical protein